MPPGRHVARGQGERCINSRRPEASLAEEARQPREGWVFPGQILNRKQFGQTGPFKRCDPYGRTATPLTPGPCASGKINAKESRLTHSTMLKPNGRKAKMTGLRCARLSDLQGSARDHLAKAGATPRGRWRSSLVIGQTCILRRQASLALRHRGPGDYGSAPLQGRRMIFPTSWRSRISAKASSHFSSGSSANTAGRLAPSAAHRHIWSRTTRPR